MLAKFVLCICGKSFQHVLEMPWSKTIVLLCLVDVAFVYSHMCTVGADYKYCYRVTTHNDDVTRKSERVYTVHQCRDICDKKGCIAFQYRARARNHQQSCILFYGKNEHVRLSPHYDRCNDETWSYSWKRLPEPSNGHCIVSRRVSEVDMSSEAGS